MKKKLLFSIFSAFSIMVCGQDVPQGFTTGENKVIYKVEQSNPTGKQVEEGSLVFARFQISFNDSIVMSNLNQPATTPTFLVTKQNNVFKGDLMDAMLLMKDKEDYTFAFPKDSMAKAQPLPNDFEGFVYYRIKIDSICSYEDFVKTQQARADSLQKIEQEKINQYLKDNNWEEKNVEGVYIKELAKGNGEKATQGDNVKIHYIGQLLDGKIFDTSIEDVAKENNLYNEHRKYLPLEFKIGAGQMIPGFEIAARQMNKGSKCMVLIPSSFAYRDRDMGAIPPYSPLIFTMEMIDIERATK
ncbi:MAG: FKBP-type peptidyl-prolyl cis-trans isomerase [Bacteroidota bacterium]|nr:FKBP-type peptidyl-prolyl cis-trans isomerase [Bacteroidota bacterium]